jgi:hypothetical protein
MSNIHSICTTLIDQLLKGVFEKKRSFSFNGRDAKMYMGLKIYNIMENDTHQTLNLSLASLNPKPKVFFFFFRSLSFLFYCLGMSQL